MLAVGLVTQPAQLELKLLVLHVIVHLVDDFRDLEERVPGRELVQLQLLQL